MKAVPMKRLLAVLLPTLLFACDRGSDNAGDRTPDTTAQSPATGVNPAPPPTPDAAAHSSPAHAFISTLMQHCGLAYAGRVITDTPPAAENSVFADQALIMHVRECSEDEIRIPFHVGEDRSRTWVLTPTEDGLRLKHDHRHEDGSEDAVTQYGGDTATAGTAVRQEFPADEFSVRMFEREGLEASVTNVWAIEAEDHRFMYELSRPGGRLFQVEFDLSNPVSLPPAPWGSEASGTGF